MESIYIELALYGSKNESARTDTVFLPISEVCNGTFSLLKSFKIYHDFFCIICRNLGGRRRIDIATFIIGADSVKKIKIIF